MKGKEALEKIKYFRAYINADGCEIPICEIREYKIIKKELELLAKYKRAFEILKKADIFMLEESFGLYKAITGDKTEYFEKEEYELLEELFKGLEN